MLGTPGVHTELQLLELNFTQPRLWLVQLEILIVELAEDFQFGEFFLRLVCPVAGQFPLYFYFFAVNWKKCTVEDGPSSWEIHEKRVEKAPVCFHDFSAKAATTAIRVVQYSEFLKYQTIWTRHRKTITSHLLVESYSICLCDYLALISYDTVTLSLKDPDNVND